MPNLDIEFRRLNYTTTLLGKRIIPTLIDSLLKKLTIIIVEFLSI